MSQEVTVKTLPPELQKFNWGAFLLSWIWGIGNNSYITMWAFLAAVLVYIPFIGPFIPLALCIWFGTQGNQWAWQNREWNSVEHFNEVQKKWAIGGAIAFVVFFVFTIVFTLAIVGIAAATASKGMLR